MAKRAAAKRAGRTSYRVRVRMYRHGLGDCFLLSFRRPRLDDFHILIDFGVLSRTAAEMRKVAESIREAVKGKNGRSRIDVVVATHEHQDHLSGFNQAREIFDGEIEIGAVWMGWTENLTKPEVKKLKETKRKAERALRASLASPRLLAAATDGGKATVEGVRALLEFQGAVEDGTDVGRRTIADAMAYLKKRGREAGDLQFLEPGAAPKTLPGVPGVRVFVLGPPRDPALLKASAVTERMKRDGLIYHLARTGETGIDALEAATKAGEGDLEGDRYQPFAAEHAIRRDSAYFEQIRGFVTRYYDGAGDEWRKIDEDWMTPLGRLALDLDSDTNNTSLVLAFEFEETGEVLLFVGDAQAGNWQSWAKVSFPIPGREKPLPAHELVARTVFYKVGHHCSHNATLKAGGLELMTSEELVAFVPLDQQTAKSKVTKRTPEGWDMPAAPLLRALQKKTKQRVVISDRPLPGADFGDRVVNAKLYVDYLLP